MKFDWLLHCLLTILGIVDCSKWEYHREYSDNRVFYGTILWKSHSRVLQLLGCFIWYAHFKVISKWVPINYCGILQSRNSLTAHWKANRNTGCSK